MALGWFNLLVAAFALMQVIRYARGALLFVAPAVRLRADADAPPATPARLRAGAELEALGFVSLGTLHEAGPLGAFEREVDVYGGPRGIFADVAQDRAGEPPVIELLTTFADGAVVLTSAGRRRAVVSATAQVGAMQGAGAGALLAAHGKAVTRWAEAHGAPAAAGDLEARLEAGRRWWTRAGRHELRRSSLAAFAVVVVALVLFGSSAHILLHAPAAR